MDSLLARNFSVTLEVCVDSVQSAKNAVQAGADRLELCSNLGLGGGTTPSLGLLKAVPVMVMIRPRTGDFLYNDDELDVMLEDIRIFKRYPIRGIVVGILTPEGRVDTERTKRIVDAALPLEVCFHRAFDMTRDHIEALRDIVNIVGISRILTSGHGRTVVESIDTLVSLFRAANRIAGNSWPLTILPGSGVNANTIDSILVSLLPLGLEELHMSGGSWLDGEMQYRREALGMGVSAELEWAIWQTDGLKVGEVRAIVDNVCDKFGRKV
ncbi:CutC family-domain-containing protein [Armillaria luteobubalina]|uniref:Copper homeostasis protein cutC homolog n=1 Tax=Armillaria luteobubalina TaxID=153913 RepID=A0AA39QQ42_9AGAR|nr:CutC family-domain-containing protein [Armillaria luteobubalina]